MTTLEDMAPADLLIDEAFMISRWRNTGARFAVYRETHLTVGVGIAQTKTLAKLANHAAKSGRRPAALLICHVERQRKLMALVPVEDVWGVGRRISKKLNAMGIETAKDLAEQSTG